MKKLYILLTLILFLPFASKAQGANACVAASPGTVTGACYQWVAPTNSPVPVASYNLYVETITGTSCTAFTPSPSQLVASGVTTTYYNQNTAPTSNICAEIVTVSSSGVLGAASAPAFFSPAAPGAAGSLTISLP